MSGTTVAQHYDLAFIALYLFWAFFAGLIYYLQREGKREGYPLVHEYQDRWVVEGFPGTPSPKTYLLPHGGSVTAPRKEVEREVAILPTSRFVGLPFEPTGNPMQDGVGAASYAMRADTPDLSYEDSLPKIVPLRATTGWSIASDDPDPRGMAVVCADGRVAGIIVDVWVDRSEVMIRYLEADVPTAAGNRRVLVPMPLARINNRRQVNVKSVLASQFAEAPGLQHPDQITLREEDRISGYFAGGQLYATPSRMGPVL